MDRRKVRNVKKIGVLRANGIGDLIVTLPAIDALKRTYPDAEIILFGKKWHYGFLKPHRTAIDRVIILPESFFIAKEVTITSFDQAMEKFISKIKGLKLDIAIHFHGEDIFSNIFLKQISARVTVGHEHTDAVTLDRQTSCFYYQSEMYRYIELVELVGCEPTLHPTKLQLSEVELKNVKKYLIEKNILHDFIILHPGTNDLRRQWPISKFAELARMFISNGFSIIITGVLEEEEILNELESIINDKNCYILQDLDLTDLACTIQFSKLFVSADTGPLHIARALNHPSVGIFWGPNVINWASLGRKNFGLAISWELKCPNCGIIPTSPYPFQPQNKDCKHLYSFVKNVKVNEVYLESERVLGQFNSTTPRKALID